MVDQALVNVQLCHVVHNDRALEVCVLMLVLENVLEQSGFARAEEAAEKGDRNTAVPSEGVFLEKKFVSDKKSRRKKENSPAHPPHDPCCQYLEIGPTRTWWLDCAVGNRNPSSEPSMR